MINTNTAKAPVAAAPSTRARVLYLAAHDPLRDPGEDWELWIEGPASTNEWERLTAIARAGLVAEIAFPALRSLPLRGLDALFAWIESMILAGVDLRFLAERALVDAQTKAAAALAEDRGLLDSVSGPFLDRPAASRCRRRPSEGESSRG